MNRFHAAVSVGAIALLLQSGRLAAADRVPAVSGVVELLEDNAEALLPLLTNPTGDPGEGRVEATEVFSGATAVKIIPMQRFQPQIPGWNHRIVERPGPGEYRYVRFAWRSDGCVGTMVQFHIETGWSIRYCAGQNVPGWGSKSVAPAPPERWTVVTRDLFADFGACTVTGIAMTCFGGQAAYFDHIYFGRTIEDLDRVDPTAVRGRGPVVLGAADRERLWESLCGDDARAAYRARWRLAADPERSAPFLKEKATSLPSASALPERVREWVAQLDADDPTERRRASEQLARHADAAADVLRREAEDNPSPEVRVRSAAILTGRAGRGPFPDPAREAVRTLGLMEGRVARDCLEALASGPEGATTTEAARAAIRAR